MRRHVPVREWGLTEGGSGQEEAQQPDAENSAEGDKAAGEQERCLACHKG